MRPAAEPALSLSRLTPIALAAILAAGCAGPQVRTLGKGGGAPAYELRGSSLAAIEAEAHKLCGRGFELVRVSQSFARPEPDDNPAALWLVQAGDWLAGMPGAQAQATVICRT
jgi:hypothetical protein